MKAHTMFVCNTCVSKWVKGKRIAEKLLKPLQANYPNRDLNQKFTIQPVECMGACNRSCLICFASPSKTTYLFGDIFPDLTPAEVEGVFDCAGKYYFDPKGYLPWAGRPQPLKEGILARIPTVDVSVEKVRTVQKYFGQTHY